MAPQGAQTDSQTSLVASLRFKSIMMGSIGTVPASHAMMYGTPVPRSQTAARYFQYLWSNKARVTTDGGDPKQGTLGPFVLSFVPSFAHPFVAHGWKHNLAAEDSKKKCADTGWTGPPGLVSHSPLTRRQIFPLPSAGASRAHLAWMCGIAAEMHHTDPWYVLPNRRQVT